MKQFCFKLWNLFLTVGHVLFQVKLVLRILAQCIQISQLLELLSHLSSCRLQLPPLNIQAQCQVSIYYTLFICHMKKNETKKKPQAPAPKYISKLNSWKILFVMIEHSVSTLRSSFVCSTFVSQESSKVYRRDMQYDFFWDFLFWLLNSENVWMDFWNDFSRSVDFQEMFLSRIIWADWIINNSWKYYKMFGLS